MYVEITLFYTKKTDERAVSSKWVFVKLYKDIGRY